MNSTSKTGLLSYYQKAIFTALFIGYACYLYNRKSVSLAIPKLIEGGLHKNEAGLIVSSQNLAYAISKFASGVLSDQMSANRLFTFGLLLSGFSAIFFSYSSSTYLFAFLWFLNGFGQGAGWPVCAKLLRQWYPSNRFGTLWSILSASANISSSLSPFISTYMIFAYGWRASVCLSGVVSVVMAVLAYLVILNSPEEIGCESFAKSIDKPKKDAQTSNTSTHTWKDLLTDPFIWIVSFSYLSVYCSKTGASDWGQVYFLDELKREPYVGTIFASTFEAGGFFGGILAGWLTDLLLTSGIKIGSGNQRMPIALALMIGVSVCFHMLYFFVNTSTSVFTIGLLGATLGACIYGPIAIFGVVATESVPIHLSGTSHAIVALAANVGAIVAGLPFSYIATYYNWATVFFLLEALSILTVILMAGSRNTNSRLEKIKTN